MKFIGEIVKTCTALCLAAWLLHLAVYLIEDVWWVLVVMAGIVLGVALLIRYLRNRRW